MTKQIMKIMIVLSVSFFTYIMAAESATINFTGITEAKLGNDDGAAFQNGGDTKDDFNIKAKVSIDNVSAHVNFGDDTAHNVNLTSSSATAKPVLEFQSAWLTVSDLLDGMLSLTFYDVGHGAGKGSAILPDYGAHGVSMTLKPMDLLTVGLKYGISADSGLNSGQYAPTYYISTNTSVSFTETTGNSDIHLLSLSLGLNLDILPTTLYFGVIMNDRAKRLKLVDAATNTYYSADASKIQLMNMGLTIDALAALKPGALKIDFGMALAGNNTVDVVKTIKDTASDKFVKATNESASDFEGLAIANNIDYVIIAHGGVTPVENLGLDYYFHFSSDTTSKHRTLGDYDDDTFSEQIKFTLTPSYTLGNFKIALGMGFKRYSALYAAYYKGFYDAAAPSDKQAGKAYNAIDLDPSITWTVASGMSVKFLYELDMTLGGDSIYKDGETLDTRADAIEHTIGMTTSISLGITGAEAEEE